ncbi:MAG: hypothetical protein R6U21_03555 [Thermoplasmatota archaeon]
MPSERTEDYLEALAFVIDEKGFAKVKDIAEYLSVSPSSVTEMFQKLKQKKYINYEKYRGVTLTKKGNKIAVKTKKSMKHSVNSFAYWESLHKLQMKMPAGSNMW